MYAGENTSFNSLYVTHSFHVLYHFIRRMCQRNTSSTIATDTVLAMLSGIAGEKRIQITKD
jgi:hypothetical protein